MPLPQSVHSSTQALMLRTSSSVYLAIVNADLSSASLYPGSGHCARGVGAAVGAAVGLTVGLAAGARVGVEVGLAVGLGVGPELCGDAEGGSVVGARVGAEVVRGWRARRWARGSGPRWSGSRWEEGEPHDTTVPSAGRHAVNAK